MLSRFGRERSSGLRSGPRMTRTTTAGPSWCRTQGVAAEWSSSLCGVCTTAAVLLQAYGLRRGFILPALRPGLGAQRQDQAEMDPETIGDPKGVLETQEVSGTRAVGLAAGRGEELPCLPRCTRHVGSRPVLRALR